jgi:hypothetical protein
LGDRSDSFVVALGAFSQLLVNRVPSVVAVAWEATTAAITTEEEAAASITTEEAVVA